MDVEQLKREWNRIGLLVYCRKIDRSSKSSYWEYGIQSQSSEMGKLLEMPIGFQFIVLCFKDTGSPMGMNGYQEPSYIAREYFLATIKQQFKKTTKVQYEYICESSHSDCCKRVIKNHIEYLKKFPDMCWKMVES